MVSGRGVVGHYIDRCIINTHTTSFILPARLPHGAVVGENIFNECCIIVKLGFTDLHCSTVGGSIVTEGILNQ